MRQSGGYHIITSPGQQDVEHDTYTCPHCNAISLTRGGFGRPLQVVVIRNDQSIYVRDADFCRKCMGWICPRCVGKDCKPIEVKIAEEESKMKRFIASWV